VYYHVQKIPLLGLVQATWSSCYPTTYLSNSISILFLCKQISLLWVSSKNILVPTFLCTTCTFRYVWCRFLQYVLNSTTSETLHCVVLSQTVWRTSHAILNAIYSPVVWWRICIETIMHVPYSIVSFWYYKNACVPNNIEHRKWDFQSDLHLYFHHNIMGHSSGRESLNMRWNKGGGEVACVILHQSIFCFDIPLPSSIIYSNRRLHEHAVKQHTG